MGLNDENVPLVSENRVKRFFLGRSLERYIRGGRDNILQLRLVAALFVVLGHCYALIGHGAPANDPLHLMFPRTYTHLIGVMIFFMISGLLITLSWQRRPSLGRFLRARALRLWPALVVCVFVWALLLGPLITRLPLADYFTRDSVYTYLFGNASLIKMQWVLPGVF